MSRKAGNDRPAARESPRQIDSCARRTAAKRGRHRGHCRTRVASSKSETPTTRHFCAKRVPRLRRRRSAPPAGRRRRGGCRWPGATPSRSRSSGAGSPSCTRRRDQQAVRRSQRILQLCHSRGKPVTLHDVLIEQGKRADDGKSAEVQLGVGGGQRSPASSSSARFREASRRLPPRARYSAWACPFLHRVGLPGRSLSVRVTTLTSSRWPRPSSLATIRPGASDGETSTQP